MSVHLSLRIMSVLKQRVKFCSDCLNMLGGKVEMVCLEKKNKKIRFRVSRIFFKYCIINRLKVIIQKSFAYLFNF